MFIPLFLGSADIVDNAINAVLLQEHLGGTKTKSA